jgi:CDP-6-deoxy-D-xylo-4-hexulose-3-dehydrase
MASPKSTAAPTTADILAAVKDWFEHRSQAPFVAGQSYVPVTGKVLEAEDAMALVEASLDLWLTSGRFTEAFEHELTKVIGCRKSLMTNSGSSANLVAISALTSPKLGSERLRAGDEVITAAAGFPATMAPIVQNGGVPVFVDVTLETLSPSIDALEQAIGPKTRAIVLAHTLGVPFPARAVRELCDRRRLFLVEDACDALGGTEGGRNVGTFGHFATASFYPAHHITTGEGGAVFCNDARLVRAAESFRDWGRDCWCAPGKDNTCGKRFGWKLGSLPEGYDHKYVYTHLGYNLKATDLQAAIGRTQLSKLPKFTARRRENFAYLRSAALAAKLDEFFLLPDAPAESDPSWFGFPLIVREGAPLSRNDIVRKLEDAKIGTRPLFAGNMVRQPMLDGREYRVVGDLRHADRLMSDCFWVGVWPGLGRPQLDYIVDTLNAIVRKGQS